MRNPNRKFWFILALALGMSVAECQEKVTSREFSEWRAFYAIEPFGNPQADFSSGDARGLVENIFAGSKVKMTSSSQPLREPPARGQSVETKAFLEAMGAVRMNK